MPRFIQEDQQSIHQYRNHRWWHFIYGTETKKEKVYKSDNFSTTNYWDVCKKCGEQVSEKQGISTFSMEITIIPTKEHKNDNTTKN
jgi:hypothetical protein